MVKGDPTRRRSNNEHAPNNAALQGILAVSDTLTYKQVRRFFLSLFVSYYGVFFASCFLMWCFAPYLQCCGSGINIPDPGSEFFTSRIRIKKLKYFNPKKLFLSSRKCDTACSSTIPDPGVKKPPDPGSATLLVC
jgi:hypothetical protein